MTSHEAAAFVVAQSDPGGQGEDFGKSSPLGLLLLLVLLVAVALLIWSMSRHVRRLPDRFDEQRAEAAAPARARSTGDGGGAEAAVDDDTGDDTSDSGGEDAGDRTGDRTGDRAAGTDEVGAGSSTARSTADGESADSSGTSRD